MALPRSQLLIGALLIFALGVLVVAYTQFNNDPVDFVASGSGYGRCNVGIISLEGELTTAGGTGFVDSLSIAQRIRALDADKSKKAVAILVNTTGGSAAAAEEIAGAVGDLDVPNVAFVREFALSGGYWVAAATDRIVSLSTSLIGNIGVTGSYLEETGLNEKEGYTYREITSGEYKEVGSPNKPLTAEHRAFLQQNVDELFAIFADVVRTYRGLSAEQFAEVADGRYYLAARALELQLIDEIGGIAEVKEYLASTLAVSAEDLLFCEPESFEE